MQQGTVRVSGLNLRASPSTGDVVKTLRKSSRLTVLDSETWLRVRTRDGREGFVFGDFVELDREPPSPEILAEVESAEEPSATLVPVTYVHPRFIGSTATVDADFVAALDRIADFAERCSLKVFVTSSMRDPEGAITHAVVEPAKHSNHFVGHAIDMNLQLDTGAFFNSSKLKKLDQQPSQVRDFIQALREDGGLRWGGDFSTPDVVHIDDGLNVRKPEAWASKFGSRR